MTAAITGLRHSLIALPRLTGHAVVLKKVTGLFRIRTIGQIRAGAEMLPGSGQDRGANVVALGNLVEDRNDFVSRLAIERVHRRSAQRHERDHAVEFHDDVVFTLHCVLPPQAD